MSTMMTTDRPRGSFSFSSEFLCSGLTLADVGADAKPVAAPTQAPESPEAPVATIPTEVTDHSVVLVETDPTEATPPAADDLEGAREALARYELALERCWSLNLELTAAQGELETAEGEEAVTAAHEKVAAAQLAKEQAGEDVEIAEAAFEAYGKEFCDQVVEEREAAAAAAGSPVAWGSSTTPEAAPVQSQDVTLVSTEEPTEAQDVTLVSTEEPTEAQDVTLVSTEEPTEAQDVTLVSTEEPTEAQDVTLVSTEEPTEAQDVTLVSTEEPTEAQDVTLVSTEEPSGAEAATLVPSPDLADSAELHVDGSKAPAAASVATVVQVTPTAPTLETVQLAYRRLVSLRRVLPTNLAAAKKSTTPNDARRQVQSRLADAEAAYRALPLDLRVQAERAEAALIEKSGADRPEQGSGTNQSPRKVAAPAPKLSAFVRTAAPAKAQGTAVSSLSLVPTVASNGSIAPTNSTTAVAESSLASVTPTATVVAVAEMPEARKRVHLARIEQTRAERDRARETLRLAEAEYDAAMDAYTAEVLEAGD